jgi:hypothetical protein
MGDVSIRATTRGRAYAPPALNYPPEGGGFQPESVFDELRFEIAFSGCGENGRPPPLGCLRRADHFAVFSA